MAFEWTEHSFRDLIAAGLLEIGDGYRAKNSELGGDGPIFLRAGHVRDTHIDFAGVERFHSNLAHAVASKMSRSGDVIITTKGNSTGRASYVTKEMPSFVYSPHLSYWRSLRPEVIAPNFLRFWVSSGLFRNQLAGLAASTDMAPYLSLIDQKRIRIKLPLIQEQVEISGILGALDDKMALNRRMNETLEAVARSLFKSWFVDFDPVRAKAEGREPEGMDAATAALFPSEFESSRIGPIPKGWRLSPLLDVSDVVYGAAFASKAFNTEKIGLPLIRIRDLKTMTPAVFTNEIHPKRYLVKPGEVIVGMDGEFRAYHWLGERAWLNQRVCVFKSTKLGGRTFIREALRPLLDRVERGQVGTTVIHIGKADIDRFETTLGPPGVMTAFSNLAESMLDRITCNSEEIRSLTQIRDTLLPRLISGKLRVPEVEKRVEAVL
jgi:type I restriction enzyme S subunit